MRLQTYAIVITAFLVLVTQIILGMRVRVLHLKEFQPIRNRKLRIPASVLQSFCHSEPGINARSFKGRTQLNCFGHCDRKAKGAARQPRAIVAPPVTRLCFDNPFHGFYDCIWPLVHYISTCTSPHEARELIIHDSKNISNVRQKKWVTQAKLAFLRNIGENYQAVERTDLPRCTCYNHVVRFKRNTMWRPVRFHSKSVIGNNTITSPHPTGLKRVGLQLFRNAVLKELKLSSEPIEGKANILIYGREDTLRRRWVNVDDFEQKLRRTIKTNMVIKRWEPITKEHDSFEKQVRQMNSAAVVIAPHGGGMVNTLFCRRKTAVIEIASRKCAVQDGSVYLSEAMDVNDENTWTPWHADSLELVHFAAPCWYSSTDNYDFYTDTEELVRLVQIALHARQQV